MDLLETLLAHHQGTTKRLTKQRAPITGTTPPAKKATADAIAA
jgi:hypothetical protein